ncbi:UNVERIFIED_ORG: hexosaminidase [Kosakonia oryzae]|uniref:beta-N-acetylhexosaminidase n=1 Tax=Kosakonia radicincitans TaxID=283686 RepID=A0AAX2EMF2_9ENTR|nr:beta-N-acetylhexosaminidase [Kosakonia radicincitans]MDP9564758.1 hexosaminidase [Kosakonia oryzae]APG17227.1 beta-N-acetylhexosaminidase [Kosakonia radicincitans]SFD96567.1 hexosaminidase [Kosakonia radicincitans]SFQ98960.1 hexosaminidase [Kosakonia radicincitans]SFT44797.1 hexosaminidase [Kosakonia radicincitans]
MKTVRSSILASAIFGVLSSPALANQNTVDAISQFHLNYAVKDNFAAQNGIDCAKLGADWASCNKAVITLTNKGEAVTDKDWAIYFHSIRPILEVANDQFKVSHIMGDLHKLEPTDKFTGFPAKQAVEIPVVNEYWQLFVTDVLPRWYVTAEGATAKVIANTDTEDLFQFVTPLDGQWKRTPDDKNILMTAEARFEKNSDVKALNLATLRGQIIPTPQEVKISGQDVDLSKGVKLDLSALGADAQEAVKSRFALLGVKEGSYPIRTEIAVKAFAGDEAISGAYQLHIGANEAVITGFDQAGVFYGLQSLLSLIPSSGEQKIARLEAKDAPRFDYRGIQLDVGRNFHSKDAVLRLLDQMSAYKLNKFHFHLTDDEGWRIEIPGLPELTDIGSKRCHDLSEKTCLLPQLGSGPDSNNNGSGHFSRTDYIDILKYAKARQIEVIPEIDMPAHARAAVISMEARYERLMKEGKEKEANQYRLLDPTDTSNTTGVQFYNRTGYLNPCLDSSRNFVDKVIGEIQQMHKEAGVPLNTWHFGGDEAKNIYLGAGYTDQKKPEAGKGIIDQSKQDKPWAKSQVCQTMVKEGKVADVEHLSSYFGIEVSKLVKAHGIGTMQAWQDGLKDAKNAAEFATDHVNVNFWDTLYWGGFDSVNDWANKGFRVIVSNPDYVYLDFPNEVHPAESGYYWGTRFSDERKIFSFAPDNMPQNAETSLDRDGNPFSAKSDKPWPGAYGLSAQLWSEVVRTDNQMEYMIYPRMIAVAERAWHRAGWEQDYQAGREYKGGETHLVDVKALDKDWSRFANLLGHRELAKLDKAGINYRLPVPGARVVGGKLEANTSFPGMVVEYSTDGGKNWLRYDNKARPQVSGEVQIRTASPDGKRFSRVDSVKA